MLQAAAGYAESGEGEADRWAGAARRAAGGGAGAGEDGSARALRAGHVGVDGRDDRRAHRAARRLRGQATARAARRPPRPTSARTCGARWRPSGWGSSATARRSRGCTQHARRRSRRWSAATPASTSTGTTSAPARVSPTSPGGDAATPILSSVDNGWLATGLRVVASRVPELRTRAQALFDSMDFGFYYRPDVNRILFHYVPSTGEAAVLLRHDRLREPDRDLRRHREGRDPARASTTGRTARSPTPATGPGPRRSRSAPTRQYLGETVFEGALPYAGMRVTPSWGGSMFEALMPALFVPEERWGPGSWGVNHPLWPSARRSTTG